MPGKIYTIHISQRPSETKIDLSYKISNTFLLFDLVIYYLRETMCIILVADDDKNIRENLMHFLSDEGFKVFLAKDGLEAFNKALDIKPDIILSDINMPIVDGFELLKRLKANKATSLIPFIFLTAETKPEKFIDDISNGVIDFIIKPFNFIDLLTVIKRLMGKKQFYNK